MGDLVDFERAGMLLPVRLPGGDGAAEEPWRMACAWLALVRDGDPPRPRTVAVDDARWRAVAEMAVKGTASPLTTSIGRLFDAVAALCGLRTTVTYEGQAAVELEAALDPGEVGAYEIALEGTDPLVLDPRACVAEVLADLERGAPVGTVSARFHEGVALATSAALSAWPAPAASTWRCSPAACSRTARCSSAPRRWRRARGSGCSRRWRCPRTTGGSPSGRRPWPPRGR